MSADEVGGLVRTVLSFGGGYAVAHGLVDQATMLTIVGALATLVTAGWSIWAKRAAKAAA